MTHYESPKELNKKIRATIYDLLTFVLISTIFVVGFLAIVIWLGLVYLLWNGLLL